MRFLADMGVAPSTVSQLQKLGYDAVHLSNEGLMRLPDSQIVVKGRTENRVILTFDLDFTDLLAVSGESLPSVIIFRLKNTLPSFVSSRLITVITECGETLNKGAIIIVEDARYRVRRLPLG
jgi:predicted nuclease of predicted toxin-antitoxin system